MLKKYFANPYLLMLLASNIYCIWYFNSHSNGFVTVVWIYWLQSVIIGFFNFVDLLTIKNYDAGDIKVNGQPMTEKGRGCLPWFFAVHFGIFHLVYMIFIAVYLGINVDKRFFLIGVAAFLSESLSSFIRQKNAGQQMKFEIGSIFFLPYLRVIPMHLMIMGSVFLHVQPSLIFLVLKTIADILSFMWYQKIWEKAAGK